MKGNKKLLAIAVLLLLITVSLSTYAIYKSSHNADATVTAATWQIAFKDGNSTTLTNSITFTTAECTSNHVKPGKIAPGASCSKTIILDATGTEVDVAYSATAGAVTASKGGNSVATTGANAFTASLSPTSGTIEYNAQSQTASLTLSVQWDGTDDATTNAADTGLEGATITVPVTLTATQVPVSSS